jgi:DNA mismatch repair protein MutL
MDASPSNEAEGAALASGAGLGPALSSMPVLQVHRRYVVVEDAQGLTIIDQHALHERVMFERLHDRLGSGALESQRLLTPMALTADRAALAALEEHAELLARLGFEVAPAGPESVLVHGVPTLLHSRSVDALDFLSELLERAGAGELPPERQAALVEVLSMMACKAAVKSGDALTASELAALLAQRESIESSSACPHGRPTSLRITLEELDRWFGRR